MEVTAQGALETKMAKERGRHLLCCAMMPTTAAIRSSAEMASTFTSMLSMIPYVQLAVTAHASELTAGGTTNSACCGCAVPALTLWGQRAAMTPMRVEAASAVQNSSKQAGGSGEHAEQSLGTDDGMSSSSFSTTIIISAVGCGGGHKLTMMTMIVLSLSGSWNTGFV
jgi:hypothetical protein